MGDCLDRARALGGAINIVLLFVPNGRQTANGLQHGDSEGEGESESESEGSSYKSR
jgi:hypothetical protein